MGETSAFFELGTDSDIEDPDEQPISERKVVTQPYDLVTESLVEQIKSSTIFLRPLSERPRFQRRFVWSDELASKLIESILLNVPIPPCYLSQNDEYELDVIDGQQRIYSLYRFLENQFPLKNLEVLKDISGLRFFELPLKTQRQIKTHTLRCVLITNESHPEIKFDVFERLNTNTVPLNSQELRNCIYRGNLNNLLGRLSESPNWLAILGRKTPDIRLRDEEAILRFFGFHIHGLASYRTPQKHWLNQVAKAGKKYTEEHIQELADVWNRAIDASSTWFNDAECFRRPGSRAINKALFDLVSGSAKQFNEAEAEAIKPAFRDIYYDLLTDEEFLDLISRAVDHTKRTRRRFEMWNTRFAGLVAPLS
jgi:hypothetical protein